MCIIVYNNRIILQYDGVLVWWCNGLVVLWCGSIVVWWYIYFGNEHSVRTQYPHCTHTIPLHTHSIPTLSLLHTHTILTLHLHHTHSVPHCTEPPKPLMKKKMLQGIFDKGLRAPSSLGPSAHLSPKELRVHYPCPSRG